MVHFEVQESHPQEGAFAPGGRDIKALLGWENVDKTNSATKILAIHMLCAIGRVSKEAFTGMDMIGMITYLGLLPELNSLVVRLRFSHMIPSYDSLTFLFLTLFASVFRCIKNRHESQ